MGMFNPVTDPVRAQSEFSLDVAREDMVERLRNQIAYSSKAMAALMIANGGALIGLFTFIGNLIGKRNAELSFHSGQIWIAFALFCAGVSLVLLTHLFAFLSQLSFYYVSHSEVVQHQEAVSTGVFPERTTGQENGIRTGNRYMVTGIVTLMLSLLCFMVGCGFALAGVLPR